MSDVESCQNAVYLLRAVDEASAKAVGKPDEIAAPLFDIAVRALEIGSSCVFMTDECKKTSDQACPKQQETDTLRQDYERL